MHVFAVDDRLARLRVQLRDHPLYAALRRPRDLRTFLQHHVFCVWDFMSLLKALQRQLTSIDVPWLPTADPVARRLINEIVLGEESDEDGMGGHLSHFELYLAAMRDIGADMTPIERFLSVLRAGGTVDAGLEAARVPSAVAVFVRQTLDLARSAPLHRLAAAFALGREDVIPTMFVRLLEELAEAEPGRYGRFLYYLRRHVDLDGDSHGPAAIRIVERACGEDPVRRREALDSAATCLEARVRLWDAIHAVLRVDRPFSESVLSSIG
jgi:Protein of unknown function (DUF3050)